MKKIFSILMLAMFAMCATVMVACDDDDDDNNGGNNIIKEAAANTLVLNGKVYQITSHYEMGGDRTYASAETIEVDGNGDPLYTIIADVEGYTLNQTYTFPDIPTQGGVFWCIHDANWDFQIGPELEKGSMTIGRTDNLFTYKVSGKIGNQTVAFHISVPASEWEDLGYRK